MMDDYKYLKDLDDDKILKLRAMLERELERRGIAFSVGSLGEKLCVEHFNSTPGLLNLSHAPTGVKNVDALSRDGERYSIKTAKKAKKTGTIYPDRDDANKQLFEYILVVFLDEDYNLTEIYRFCWERFTFVRSWDKRMSAWYISLSKKNLKEADAILKHTKI